MGFICNEDNKAPIGSDNPALAPANFISDLDPALQCGEVPNNTLPMGLGALGNGSIIFKRKFRWTMEIEYCCDNPQGPKTVARQFVKAGNRPQIEFDEVQIDYLNARTWIPGKGVWQPIEFTYYDVAGTAGLGIDVNTSSILSWIASIYDFTDPVCLPMNSALKSYEGIGRLILWDGCGNPLEGWILRHMWPKTVNWGDLDMTSNDECTITLTMRYSDVSYRSYCPDQPFDKCPCLPCP